MKADASKVDYYMAETAVKRASSRGSVYTECIRISYQTTGGLDCGFNANDLQAWININMPDVFDEKGNKHDQPR